MKIKVIGISEKVNGVGKKSGKAYSGYFVSYGYLRPEVRGMQADSFLLSDTIVAADEKKYVPSPGDLCDLSYGRGGFVESIKFISKGELT